MITDMLDLRELLKRAVTSLRAYGRFGCLCRPKALALTFERSRSHCTHRCCHFLDPRHLRPIDGCPGSLGCRFRYRSQPCWIPTLISF